MTFPRKSFTMQFTITATTSGDFDSDALVALSSSGLGGLGYIVRFDCQNHQETVSYSLQTS
jgi:hypothetical protein